MSSGGGDDHARRDGEREDERRDDARSEARRDGDGQDAQVALPRRVAVGGDADAELEQRDADDAVRGVRGHDQPRRFGVAGERQPEEDEQRIGNANVGRTYIGRRTSSIVFIHTWRRSRVVGRWS